MTPTERRSRCFRPLGTPSLFFTKQFADLVYVKRRQAKSKQGEQGVF